MPQAMVNIAVGEENRITYLANGQTQHSQGQRPWKASPTQCVLMRTQLSTNRMEIVPQTWGDAPGYDEYRRWRIKTE